MKQTAGRYANATTNPQWLPSQNWQEIAKRRQEKAIAAEAEMERKRALFRRRVLLALFVALTTIAIAPFAIYPRLAQADAVDAAMGYSLAQSAGVTFGSRLDNAEAIVSDGNEFATEATPQQPTDGYTEFGTDATAQQQPQQQQPQATAPVEFGSEQAQTPVATDAQAAPQQYEQIPQQPVDAQQVVTYEEQDPYQQSPPPQTEDMSYSETPAPSYGEQVFIQPQAESAQPIAQTSAASPAEPTWWSVPSWSTASAPQYDAIGVWDVHYYIAHNWTSYGETILALKNGDCLSVDGQRLRVVDSEYFPAGTSYEAVRARFGWDAWCLQTCYGDHQVRVVALVPAA